MTVTTSIVAASVSVAAAVITGIVSIWMLRHRRLVQETEAYRAISELYDRVVQAKLQRPELLPLARRWSAARMRGAYEQLTDEDRDWAIYSTYTEVCIGFCNAVLQARSRGLMPKHEFEAQWEPLVKFVITEHYPMIRDLLKEAKFVSSYLTDFVDELRTAGWDWEREHRLLAWSA